MPAVNLIVTDSGAGSPRTVTFLARVCRMFLATVAGSPNGVNAGTAADPDEWIRGHLQRKLNNNDGLSLWTCALQADGRLKISYGGTGTGQIQWDGSGGTSLIPRYLAGFDANVSLAAGTNVTGTYQVSRAAFVVSGRANTEGWTVLPKRSAIGETDDGLAAAITASRTRRVYTADWRFAPYDWATRQANSYTGTPYQPTTTARWTAQSATPSTADVPPWSLVDFFGSCHGQRVGLALGNFQALVAGSASAFYTGTLGKATLQSDAVFAPSERDNEARYDARGVTFRYASHAAR